MSLHSNNPWWKNAIIYELYVDKFSDTFVGLTQKLEYLKFIGVNCIHVLPHYPSPMIDDGYDVSDYMNVRESLGTIEDFKSFIKSAHNIGIKVIIDFVLNHTSTSHPWFIESRSSIKNDKRNFYLWSRTGKEYSKAPNLFLDLKPNNWIYNKLTNDYYFSTFHQEQADLNWNNPQVFFEMTGVLDFWMNIGVDGFRLDAASHLIKKEGTASDGLPETHAMIKKIRSHIEKSRKDIILLAEVDDSIKKTKEYFGSGDECHLVYNFPLVGQLLIALKRDNKTSLKKFIKKLDNIPENCQWVNFLGHHDELSLKIIGVKERKELFSYFDPEKKYRFGSGIARRLADMFGGNKEKIIESFKILLNLPGSAIIYYGDEIGMENELLSAKEKDTRKGLRGKFDWNITNKQKLDSKSLLISISNIIKSRIEKII